MENPFKKIGQPPKPLPKEIRKKVMDDIAVIQLLKDTAGLFTANYAGAVESFFKSNKRKNIKNN